MENKYQWFAVWFFLLGLAMHILSPTQHHTTEYTLLIISWTSWIGGEILKEIRDQTGVP